MHFNIIAIFQHIAADIDNILTEILTLYCSSKYVWRHLHPIVGLQYSKLREDNVNITTLPSLKWNSSVDQFTAYKTKL